MDHGGGYVIENVISELKQVKVIYIYLLMDVLVCSIAVYFYELCSILTSP